VTPLPTRHVQNSRTHRQGKQIEEASYLTPIPFGSEKRFVLEEIVGVKSGFPPLAALSQKNTGSR
jgi:hypothetical protein